MCENNFCVTLSSSIFWTDTDRQKRPVCCKTRFWCRSEIDSVDSRDQGFTQFFCDQRILCVLLDMKPFHNFFVRWVHLFVPTLFLNPQRRNFQLFCDWLFLQQTLLSMLSYVFHPQRWVLLAFPAIRVCLQLFSEASNPFPKLELLLFGLLLRNRNRLPTSISTGLSRVFALRKRRKNASSSCRFTVLPQLLHHRARRTTDTVSPFPWGNSCCTRDKPFPSFPLP